jgi:hypothetical protein
VDKPIVLAGDLPASTISGMVSRGELRRLATGIYSRDTTSDPGDTVRAHWDTIAGRLFPNAVITDRSARTMSLVDGVLYLARDGRPREVELPGLTIRARTGAPPQPDDIRLPSGLYFASTGRALAENSLSSRARGGRGRRTLDERELGDWIDHLCRRDGEAGLIRAREQAEALAPALGVPTERLSEMRTLVGVALGTQQAQTESAALASRRAGRPVDQARIARFGLLVEALRASAPQNRPVSPDREDTFLPFAEAYFSNFIEGTEFDFDEAARIVFDGEIPTDRPADAHDVLGTYRMLADRDEMQLTGHSEEEFEEILRGRHARIMEGRPDKRPGEFKAMANRAGATQFVDPELVAGTLAAGWRIRDYLDTPWERAVYVAFVVSEVHPFDDGNGRTARAMMSAELDAGDQKRIIVPTVFRNDYLDGLRMLSRQDEPRVFIKAMRYAHDFTASLDYSNYGTMKSQLEEANAFNEPESGDRLRILGRERPPAAPAPWRTGAPNRVPREISTGGGLADRQRGEGDMSL